jgi:hypothetical protein
MLLYVYYRLKTSSPRRSQRGLVPADRSQYTPSLMVLEALQLWVEFLFGSLFDKNKEKQALVSISTRKQSLPSSLGAGYLS